MSRIDSEKLITELHSTFGSEFTTADVKGFCASKGFSYTTVSRHLENYKVSPGKWNLEVSQKVVEEIEKSYNAPSVESKLERNLIPEKDDTFVKFGAFSDLKAILKSHLFYPTFITGLSGNGKTFGVEQACAPVSYTHLRAPRDS